MHGSAIITPNKIVIGTLQCQILRHKCTPFLQLHGAVDAAVQYEACRFPNSLFFAKGQRTSTCQTTICSERNNLAAARLTVWLNARFRREHWSWLSKTQLFNTPIYLYMHACTHRGCCLTGYIHTYVHISLY